MSTIPYFGGLDTTYKRIHNWVSFIHIDMPTLAHLDRFPIIQYQYQNPMLPSVTLEIKLIFGVWYIYIETTKYIWLVHKNELCFFRNTLLCTEKSKYESEYMTALGNTIAEMVPIIPGGVLVRVAKD